MVSGGVLCWACLGYGGSDCHAVRRNSQLESRLVESHEASAVRGRRLALVPVCVGCIELSQRGEISSNGPNALDRGSERRRIARLGRVCVVHLNIVLATGTVHLERWGGVCRLAGRRYQDRFPNQVFWRP